MAFVCGLAVVLAASAASAQEIQVRRAAEPKSTPMMYSGIVVTGLGLVSIGLGAVLLATGDTYCEPPPPPSGTGAVADSAGCRYESGQVSAGYGLVVGGVGSSIAGLPFLLYGAQQVPTEEPHSGRAAVLVSVGAGQIAVTWAF